MAESRLNVLVGAKIEGLTKGLKRAGRKLRSFERSAGRLGRSLTTNLSAPIAAIGTGSVMAAANFEKSMNKVSAVTGATENSLDKLNSQAKKLGETTQFSASQAAEAMTFLGMAGFKTEEIMSAMPATLDLAAAGSIDLASAADIASNILSGFGENADKLGHFSDVLSKGFTSSNTSLLQLGEAMSYAAPVASSFGISVEETTAALGKLSDAGIQSSMAGTGLRGILSKLSSKQKELGINTFNSAGKMHSLSSILEMISKKGISSSKIMEIFGDRAGPSMLALLKVGGDGLKQFTTELENSGGTAKKIADTQLKGFSGEITKLKSATEGLAIDIGEMLIPELTKIVHKVKNAITFIKSLTTSQKQSAISILKFTAAAGPLLMLLSKLAAGFQVILGIIPKLITGLKLLGVAITRNPLGALVTVLGLAAGYMFTFGSSTNKAKNDLDNFNKTGNTTAERLKEINDQLERSTKTELELIKEEAAARQKEIFEEMGNLSHLATERLAELQKEYNKWGDVIKKATQQQKDNSTALEDQKNKLLELQGATNGYAELVPSIAEQWGLTFEPVNNAISTITESTRTMGQVMFEQLDGIVDAAMTTKDSFKVFAGQVIQQMVRMIAKAAILAALLSVIFPQSAAGGASFMQNFGNLMKGGSMFEGKAVGGFASAGTPYLVGEHGPELFTPSGSSGGHISSASQTANMMTIPDVRISGEDLLIVFDRANRHRNSLG